MMSKGHAQSAYPLDTAVVCLMYSFSIQSVHYDIRFALE
jgi:hypothetical protein